MPRSFAPLVSVATGLYNHKPYLAERVRSILSQTVDDLEWIVVDDCSTDGSYEEIVRLTAHDRRVTVLRNESNQGFMRANQRAIEHAKGTYLYRADSDDFCDLRFLEVMTGVMDAHARVGLAHCRGLRMDVRNGVWGGLPIRKARYLEAPGAFPELALDYQIRAPSILFRRSTVMQVGGFDRRPPSLRGEWHADWHLSLRLALVSDLAFHPEALAYHRTHGTNLSSALRLNLNNFALLEDAFDNLPEPCRHYEALRPEAYRRLAERMYPWLMGLRDRGLDGEFAEGMALIVKYLPDFEPPRSNAIARALRGGLLALIKLATYRRLGAA